MTRAALVVMVSIPLLYGALYLWAFWNPTGHLDRVPVAVVNLDKGATQDNGKVTRTGQELTEKLLAGGKLKWQRTTADEAAAGLNEGKYQAILTIGSDFSSTLQSAGGKRPTAASLRVTFDDANGYTTRTIVSSVMREVRTAASDSASQKMVDKMLVGFTNLHQGVSKAATGADKLAGGTGKAATGAAKLAAGTQSTATGSRKLASAAASAQSGAGQLSTGANQLSQGVSQASQGAQKLSGGAGQLADATKTLAAGLPQAERGASQLADATGTLATGAGQLRDGLGSLAQGGAELATQTKKLATGAGQVAAGNQALASGLATASSQLTTATSQLRAALAAELPADSAALAAYEKTMTSMADQLTQAKQGAATAAAGAAEVAQGADSLTTGASRLSAGITSAHAASAQVASGALQIRTGADTLAAKLGDASSGAARLSAGASTLASGASSLASGTEKLTSGAQTLANGQVRLTTGLGQLAGGAANLASGSQQLASGAQSLSGGVATLNQGADRLSAALTSAADDIPSYSASSRSAASAVVATPITLDSEWTHQAQDNGEGLAPYFLGLALYVGALIMWMMLRPISQRSLAAPVPALRVVLASLTPALLLGAAQVALLVMVLRLGLGLQPNSMAGFALFALLVSAAFVALQQTLNIVFGTTVGRLVVLILLMLQLTSAGGTYPAVTSPGFFQALHRVMPMTQVINGFRESITGDLNHLFWVAVGYLAILTVASIAVATWAAARNRVWTINRLHPAVSL